MFCKIKKPTDQNIMINSYKQIDKQKKNQSKVLRLFLFIISG